MTDLTAEQLDELEEDLCEYDGCTATHGEMVALIAMARDKYAAERERDALRSLVVRFVALVQADDEEGYSCSDCGHRGYVPHAPHCICVDAAAVLATPTGGSE